MRTRPLIAVAVLLSGLVSGCSDDPAPARAAASASAAPVATAGPGPTPSLSSGPTAAATPDRTSAAAPRPAATPLRAPASSRTVRLTGDGIETPQRVVLFGESYEKAQPALVAALGEPTRDTGVGSSFSSYGTCPGSRLRALEFGRGALRVLFGDVTGPGMTMYQWSLVDEGRPDAVPPASALVGDVTTFEFGVGDSVAQLRAGVQGGAELEVNPGDEVFPPSFTLEDQSAGFFGFLTGTAESDTVTAVQAGEGCGE